LESQQFDSFNSERLDSPKNGAIAVAFSFSRFPACC
jgi:hypothetical protein